MVGGIAQAVPAEAKGRRALCARSLEFRVGSCEFVVFSSCSSIRKHD